MEALEQLPMFTSSLGIELDHLPLVHANMFLWILPILSVVTVRLDLCSNGLQFVHNKYFLSLSSTPCSSAISLLPFPLLLCLHIGRAGRPLEGLLHSCLPLLCLGSPLPFAQTYRSLPPLLLCHLCRPGLKIHFQKQCVSLTSTSNPLSFLLWPLSFSFNPFHISVWNVCFIRVRLTTSSTPCDRKVISLSCAFGVDSFVKALKCAVFEWMLIAVLFGSFSS